VARSHENWLIRRSVQPIHRRPPWRPGPWPRNWPHGLKQTGGLLCQDKWQQAGQLREHWLDQRPDSGRAERRLSRPCRAYGTDRQRRPSEQDGSQSPGTVTGRRLRRAIILYMSDLGAEAGSAVEQSADADLVRSVELSVRTLLGDGDVRGARVVIQEALEAGPGHADLLWTLADIEFSAGDLVAGRSRLIEAFAASDMGAAVIARRISALRRNRLWRDALLAVEEIPPVMRSDVLVRAEAGAFYQDCGCYAHATDIYGSRRSLGRHARKSQRWCWSRSGGPSALVRRNVRAWEETKLLPVLRRPLIYARQLNGITGLDAMHVQKIKIQLDTLNYQLQRRWYHWNAVGRVGYYLLPIAVVPVWLVLLLVVHLAGFAAGVGVAAGAAGISALIAAIFTVLLAALFFKSYGQLRFLSQISAQVILIYFFVVAVLEAGAGEGYDSHVLPISGWWSWVILGVVVSPAVTACLSIAGMVFDGIWQWGYRKLIREDCLLIVLDMLVDVLDDLRSMPGNHRFAIHLKHARYLEFAARWLTRDLFPPGSISFLGSGDWLARRAAGWAEALRYMQRQLVASVPDGEIKLEAFLIHEIRCLANCDLGALSWREPRPPLPRRAVVKRRAISIVRTILVAGLPLTVVLTAQQFLHASPGLFNWARITTGIWALLYVLLSIDPAIRDKIETAQQVAGLLSTTKTIGGSGDQRR
jgi:hypothetical protein